MKNHTQYDVFREIGVGMLRVIEGYPTLQEAKAAVEELIAEGRYLREEMVIQKITRIQYRATEWNL